MALHHSACPLCGGQRFVPIEKFKAHHVVRCSSCSFVFSVQEPSVEELGAYYGEYPIKEPNAITLKRFNELVDGSEPYRKLNTMLDVGCGGGDLLAVAAKRGWQVHGTEYGDAFIRHCTAKGIRMEQGPLNAATYGDQRFDVVMSFEVLEHLPRPMEMLRDAVTLLRPGGLLYLTTPNFNALSKHLAGSGWNIVNYPEHLSFFTASTLHRSLTGLGLQRISMRSTGVSVTRLRTSRGASDQKNISPVNDDEALRERLEGSALMRLAKSGINGALNLFRMGDTLKAAYWKPDQ